MKIAVVGSGISGLACAWLLARHSAGAHQVTLYEQDTRLGGHTNTIDVMVAGRTHPVDTGFLVYNDWTYPNLIALFNELAIESAPSNMSFGIKLLNERGQGQIEWCGSNHLASVFAQPTNAFRPDFWRMLADLVRFNREATKLADTAAENPALARGTLGEYLDAHKYSTTFRNWYLKPMAACIWSTPTTKIDIFPLATFITFCRNHGLLSVSHRPQWRTVKGGARRYVEAMARGITDVRLNVKLKSVTNSVNGVTLESGAGREHFDHVALACHSDQARTLVGNQREALTRCLERIPYQSNTAILHTDTRLLPDRKRAWAAWNYMAWHPSATRDSGGDAPVSLTYLINRLQPLPFDTPVMVTMNPLIAPDPAKVLRTIHYSHPIFLADSAAAKIDLRALQGKNRTWLAGAWTRYGFHEDGLMSGIAVAKALGATIPWNTNVPAANDLAARYPGIDA